MIYVKCYFIVVEMWNVLQSVIQAAIITFKIESDFYCKMNAYYPDRYGSWEKSINGFVAQL